MVLDDLSGNQCGCLVLSQVHCKQRALEMVLQEKLCQAFGQGCASAKSHFPAFEVQLSGSTNGSGAVKPDTVRMIGIKEELEHTAFSPHPHRYGGRLVTIADISLKPGDCSVTLPCSSQWSQLFHKNVFLAKIRPKALLGRVWDGYATLWTYEPVICHALNCFHHPWLCCSHF